MALCFEIQHSPGRKNMVADALSRLQTEVMDDADFDKDLPDQYDKNIGDVTGEAKEIHENTFSPKKSAFSALVREQNVNPLCQELSKLANIPKGRYSPDEHGVLTRRLRVYGALQQITPTTLRPALLYYGNDQLLAGHLGGRRMYNTMRWFYHWPHMANDFYTYVQKCLDCRKHRRHPTHQRINAF